jgi:hypothetical protein
MLAPRSGLSTNTTIDFKILAQNLSAEIFSDDEGAFDEIRIVCLSNFREFYYPLYRTFQR